MTKTEEKIVYSLADFQIGNLQDTHLALLLNYATTEEKHYSRDFETFVLALDRRAALELGQALIDCATQLPTNPPTQTVQ